MIRHPLVALDIGSTKVACAVGLPNERSPGFELLGSSIVPYPTHPESWLGDLLLVSRTIEQALEATAVREDLHRALVVSSHPSLRSEHARVSITLADEPVPVRAHDLDRLQRCALDHVLGVDRDALLVERLGCSGNGFEHVRDPRGLPATRLVGDFHVLTMPMSARRVLVQVVESAGLEMARLSSSLPAILAAVGEPELFTRRILLIDVGGLATEAGLFVEGILHRCAVMPWGGLTIARTAAQTLQATMDQAAAWTLEGTACRKPEVRRLVEEHWGMLQQAVAGVLEGQPRPDAVLVSGRGALIDGFVEWAERTTGIPTSLARSGRVSRQGNVPRQVGLSAAIGLLELATCTSDGAVARAPRLFNRLIDRTRTILTEYF